MARPLYPRKPPRLSPTIVSALGHKRSFACIAINCGSEYPRLHYGPYNGAAEKDVAGDGACTLYDVRPHAWASIFHSSPCFENVYASVPSRVAVWPLMVTASVPAMTAYASEPSTFQNPIL
jgi:hypothetical protein